MSLGGFAENTLRNVFDIAKGFVNVFPTAIKGAVDVFGDPDGLALLMENPSHLVQAFRQTGEHLKDAIIAPYEKHGFRVLYEEPITPILDAMTVLSLGGTGIAKAGRLAGNRALFDAGRRMANVPQAIGSKIESSAMKAVGINPETRGAFLRFRRQEQAGARLEAGLRKERILAGTEKLADADLASLERLILDGGTKAELAANPRIAAVRNALEEWLAKEREFELGPKGRAFLTDEQMRERVIKEYAERNKLDIATAKAKFDALEVKPLYAPAIREAAGGFDWVNAFMEPSVIKTGKVGFLERFTSARGAAAIKERIARAIDDFYVSRANLRLIDRVIQQYGKAVGKGEATINDLLPSQGVYQRYFSDKARAGSLAFDELTRTVGKDKAAQLARSDLATQQALNKAVNIVIPDRTLQKLIAREFRSVGGDLGAFLRVYDRITDLFRTSATKLSPSWYTGNIVGDALLSSLAGSNWPLAKRLIESNSLPRTLRSGPISLADQTANIPLVGERVNRFVGSLSDGVGKIDDAARAGVFSEAVAKELRSTMMRFASSEEMLRLAKEVSLAPDQLADLIVRNQQLGEHIARQSGAIMKIDGQIAKKRRELNEAIGEESRVRARQMEPAVRGKAQPFAEVVGEATSVELPARAKLLERIAANEKAATGLRADSERLAFLKNEIRDFQNELNWLKGKHPRTPDENVRLITLKQNAKDVAKEAAELEKVVAKKSKIRDENAKLKRGMELKELPPAASLPPAGPRVDISLQRVETPAIKSKGRPSADVQQELDVLTATRDAYKADLTEKAMAREIERIPELQRKAEIAEQAMDRANTFLGEYLGLGPIERGVFRRIVPFYPWMKAMSKLAFTFPFIAPGKAFFWHRYAAAMTEMMGDPELPDWLASYTPVFTRANGDIVWARFASLSPFGSLRTEKIGGIPIPSILAFWRSNPWISTGYKLIGGKDQWNGGSVPYGEDLVAVNDGEVYRFNEQGMLEKVIAQPPAIRTLAHSFPVVQMIDQLISNYDVRKGAPVFNADGTVKYSVELYQRLAGAAGVKLIQRNKNQLMAMEGMQVKQALQELRSQYKRADPERRKYIEGIFQDYSRGEYRKIAAN